MSERTEVSFDAALMMALRADAQKELDELPTPAQLKERYPDTSRWDARLQAALHKRRPMLKRVLVAALTLVILTLGALAVSADFRKTVYTMIQKFLPIEMQGYDKKETFSHAYVNAAGEIYFVDCSIITAYGQIETFDNEHTVYTTVKIGDKEATLGTSEIPGQVTCYILVWEDAGVSCTIMGDGSLDELMKVAESIY